MDNLIDEGFIVTAGEQQAQYQAENQHRFFHGISP
jgi:hypothetical protein